jgi:hypothetical protein
MNWRPLLLVAATLSTTLEPMAEAQGRSWDLLRTDFEANVDYTAEPVVKLNMPCAFDDWAKSIAWNFDDGKWENLSHKDDSGIVYSARIFSDGEVGTRRVAVSALVHCKGTPGNHRPHFTQGHEALNYTVHKQVPVESATFVGPDKDTIRSGKTARLRLMIAGFAPPSGTRVFLKSSKPAVANVPAYIVVPQGDATPGGDHDTYYLDILGETVAQPQQVDIEVWNVASAPKLTVKLNVRP